MSRRRLAARFPIVMALTLFCATALSAQARITGVVRDSAGGPIAGAEISAQGTSRTATSGADGAFQLAGIAPGTSVVIVRRLGFAPSSTILRLVDGENKLGDVVLVAVARELDTVATREQQLWREYPLLREFDENRKVGLGQFVTRTELARHQGGFMTPIFNQMRGLLFVRSATVASHAWIANTYVPSTSCTRLEDRMPGEGITPRRDADCNYCFPAVYLDYTLLNKLGEAANIGRFHPDMLEGIQVFLGAAETPARYSGRQSGCGVIVFHTRVPEVKPRIIAGRQDHPTRSRVFVSASLSAARSGADCASCGSGSARDFTLGYTLRDRWVISARHAKWNADHGGAQDITLTQGLLEWYPAPEPGRFKWFVNAGLGSMSLSLNTSNFPDHSDLYTANGLPAIVGGTGVDIALYRRFVLTPFVSHTRTVGGRVRHERCFYDYDPSGELLTQCHALNGQPGTFNLTQIGTRIGWR